jgi:hypothetical protein
MFESFMPDARAPSPETIIRMARLATALRRALWEGAGGIQAIVENRASVLALYLHAGEFEVLAREAGVELSEDDRVSEAELRRVADLTRTPVEAFWPQDAISIRPSGDVAAGEES